MLVPLNANPNELELYNELPLTNPLFALPLLSYQIEPEKESQLFHNTNPPVTKPGGMVVVDVEVLVVDVEVLVVDVVDVVVDVVDVVDVVVLVVEVVVEVV